MKFSYNELKIMESKGESLGKWHGIPVFSCCYDNLDNKGNGAYFIVYDDDNTIVIKKGAYWHSCGFVGEDGQVIEWSPKKYLSRRYDISEPQVYHYDTQTYEPAANVCGKQEECDAAHEVVVGDVKLGLDVDATLKAAREMTVDSLLEGFNYGL